MLRGYTSCTLTVNIVVCFIRDKKKELGNDLFARGDYSGAINCYQRYIKQWSFVLKLCTLGPGGSPFVQVVGIIAVNFANDPLKVCINYGNIMAKALKISTPKKYNCAMFLAAKIITDN